MRYQTLSAVGAAAAASFAYAPAASAETVIPISYTLTASSAVAEPEIVVTGKRWQAPKPPVLKWEARKAPVRKKSDFEATQALAFKWELAYLALSAVDTVQTITCLKQGICQEANPLFGKNPSSSKLVLAKVGAGLVHFYAFKQTNDRSPKTALRYAQLSAGIQGSVVLLNARFML